MPYKIMNWLLLLVLPLVSGDRTVVTNSGSIKGVSLTGKKVEAFLGIPYAEPPVGSLRFQKPVPITPWKETYDAKELPPACIQAKMDALSFMAFDPDKKMSEDCLYLNLWVPEGGSVPKPIMLFIHGGAFLIGSSNVKMYDGAALSERGDVIVATINYRLGTLGFFSAFTNEAAGNMGMHDQVMALKWVKDNAKNFGGDPNNIMVFGESAGAFSTSLHMISPLSMNLFRRSIMQSGSTFNPMYSDGNEYLFASSAMSASVLGCADNSDNLKTNPAAVVNCMMKLSAEKFSEGDVSFFTKGIMPVPRVGDDFLPINPIDSFRTGKFKDTELLLGANGNEGSILVALLNIDTFGIFGEKLDASSFNETLARKLVKPFTDEYESLKEVVDSYFAREKAIPAYTYLDVVSDLLGDFLVNCAAFFHADYHSLKQPVYFYQFDFVSESSPFAKWMGATHASEIQYVFGNPMNGKFTKEEEEVSKKMMDMWIQFTKKGSPNLPGISTWPPYTKEDPSYLIIKNVDKVGVRPDNHRCEVWRKIFRNAKESLRI